MSSPAKSIQTIISLGHFLGFFFIILILDASLSVKNKMVKNNNFKHALQKYSNKSYFNKVQFFQQCSKLNESCPTALSAIYVLLITMPPVLRWKYAWTTLGHKEIQKKSLNLNILKIIMKYSCQAGFFLFPINFVIEPISYQKKDFKILDFYILVERPLEKLHFYYQWGPHTHNSPHQMGAVSKAEQTLFLHKDRF